MVPPPSQIIVRVYNQITLLVLYYISSRLVILLRVIYVPAQAPNIFYLTVSFKFLNLSFYIFLLFVYEKSASFTSYIFRLSTLLWFGSCTHCIVARFPFYKNLNILHQTPKLKDQPLSPVRKCLFDIFASTLHIGGRSTNRNLRTRHVVVAGSQISRTECQLQRLYRINTE